ncbi:anti-sigma factor [Sinorhizobium fredii]|uniref:Anti-sigma factor n=2 Tax=Rhizobium fredii TaxID=380 RepID=A0A2A6LPT2_RHIFR|nr:anti-sigma factor [Sinorhizobium fredii]AWI55770.1 hypothetical protein AB395_000083 [Sinorhizobium fredii CCBAU 45436]AWM23371.1 hypothetical protein AOX55_000085 [Sinorhizobium fredii CCBAU 25509]KSV92555.1 anti-sigma-K factor RskA [Sinorhizobium fredii USDA 205]MCG5474457.1 anti-sigma factor [Sinorhizobium fredii]MQW94605.1 anti-sigma factor [Sinorhizobium fredii]
MTTQKPESGDSRSDEVIAGEYVLGVLSAEDRRQVEARMATDRNFAAMVVRWQSNLASIDLAYEPVAPPPHVFAAIESRVFESPASTGRSASLWNSLSFWRSLAFASLAAVAVLGISMLELFSAGQGGKPLVAELQGQGNGLGLALVAQFDTGSGRLRVTPVAARQTEEKSLELWLIKGSDPAISLGVLPQSGEGEILVRPAVRSKITEGSTLAVSLEPLGGSPTGSATGPVIALGTTRR